jgi:hypothetical protein
MDPPSCKSDSPVSRPYEQILPEQRSEVIEYLWIASWMKTMASVINRHAAEFKTAGVASDVNTLLQYTRVCYTASSQLPGSAETG